MGGFFSKKETELVSRPDGKSYSCISCGLFKTCQSPKMEPYGKFKKEIMIIGEAPGEKEDKYGKPWQGQTGNLLEDTLDRLGISLFDDCVSLNSVNCRPTDKDGDNRKPTNYELGCCRRIVIKAINDYKPKVIICLGESATYSLIGHRWKKSFDGIFKWRGWTIPDQDFKCWICPTFHPSFIERSKRNEMVAEVIWKNDLKQAISKLDQPFLIYKEPKFDFIEDLEELYNIDKSVPFIVPDFETTGRKPHAPGHKILCAGIADSPDHVYVFMIPESRSKRQPLVDILTNKGILKAGQNMKFEIAWAREILHCNINGFVHDCMIASHILDNRFGVTGLKFQTFVQFGIPDYDSEVEPYIKSIDEKNANSLNRLPEFILKPDGPKKLMTYCGYDCINEYRLANIQEYIVGSTLPF